MEASELKNFSPPKTASEKSFGITIAAALFIYSIFIKREFNFILIGSSLVLVGISFFIPKFLRLPILFWAKLGEILGRIMTPIIMGAIFFLFITPFGLLLRRFHKLQFQYKLEADQDSFWVERKEIEFSVDKFKQQF